MIGVFMLYNTFLATKNYDFSKIMCKFENS